MRLVSYTIFNIYMLGGFQEYKRICASQMGVKVLIDWQS